MGAASPARRRHRFDLPAGDFAPRAAAGLCCEVVRPGVDDDRFTDDFTDREAVRQDNLKRIAVI